MDKSISLNDLAGFVAPGATLAIGGAWLSNHPMAAVRQLVRGRVDGLRLISSLASIDVDLLIAAGAVRELTFSMVSLEAYGLAPSFRAAAERGEIELKEVSGVALNVAFDAGAHRLPFLPMRDIGGSELPERAADFYSEIACPFSGETLLAVRGLQPDVAIIHATRADREGNAQVDCSWANDPEIARAGKTTIVTCEELVDREVIAATPTATHVPGFVVDAVIEVPLGAHPTSHLPRYVADGRQLLDHVDACTGGGTEALVARLAGEDESAYRERVVPPERRAILAGLAAGSPPLERSDR